MMNLYLNRYLLLPFILVLFFLFACNSPSESESDAVLPTLAPTAVVSNNSDDSNTVDNEVVDESPVVEEVEEVVEEVVEEADETESETANVVQDEGLAAGAWTADARVIPFDTFEFGYRIETTISDGTTQFVGLTVQNSKPDSITLWTPTAGGVQDAEMLNSMRMGVFEDNSFVYAPQAGCIWSSEGASNDEILAFNTNSFLSFTNQPDAQFVGMETVNGLETYAYEVGQETLTNDMPAGTQVVEANGRFNIYELPTGELLIVKSTMQLLSNYDMFGETLSETPDIVTTFTSEITSINEPIDVQIPEECEQQAENFPYPIYPDGFVQASMEGLAIVQVAQGDKADIAEWYQTEMVNAGWSLTGSQDLGQIFLIDFQMNGSAVTVTIADDPSSGGVIISFMQN